MIKIRTVTKISGKSDTLVCLVGGVSVSQTGTDLDRQLAALIEQARLSGDFDGKKGQVLIAYPAAGKGQASQIRRLLVVGLGPAAIDREGWRQAGGVVAGQLLKTRAEEATIVVPDLDGAEALTPGAAGALAEGLLLGSYRFRKYQSSGAAKPETEPEENSEEREPILRRISIAGPRGIAGAVDQATTLAAAVWTARDMANEPGNGWTPDDFAAYGRQLARQYKLKATIIDRAAMARLGMGGILAVNQGSALPPRLVILEYRAEAASSGRRGRKTDPPAKVPTLLLVGKGLTFDSGGISLKPSGGMEEMKYDMCGGAAVLAAMAVIGREKPEGINVVAMVPATENLPGPAALKPGDIIRQYGGKSVEVINTDAEGRLIMADALAYGVEKFRPAAVIDLATLTGAVIIGLGHHYAGLLGNDDGLCARVQAAGEEAGEPLWRLPLGPEYSKQLKSKVADLKNVDKRDAGTILAAAFLQEFVGDTPWVHLDIAGTAWNFTEKSYVPKGPSGFGVRTLVELIRQWSQPAGKP